MKKLKLVFVVFTVVTLPTVFYNCTCIPDKTIGSQPVTLRPQETSMWCWAASGEMCMDFLGTNVSQCDQANKRFGRTDCCNSPAPNSCLNGGWPEFDKYGFSFKRTNSLALSWEDLKKEIYCNKRPVAFSWGWIGGGGHMMVAYGYAVVGGVKYVSIRDPWSPNVGNTRLITYEEYVSSSNHTHWDDFYEIARK